MQELVRYLLENVYLDFQGDITKEKIREFLREDDSREARALLKKILEEGGVDEMLIAVADMLKEHLGEGITDATVRDQLHLYSDS